MCVRPASRLLRADPGILQAASARAAASGAEEAAEAALPADAAGGRGEAAGRSPKQPHWDFPQQVRSSWVLLCDLMRETRPLCYLVETKVSCFFYFCVDPFRSWRRWMWALTTEEMRGWRNILVSSGTDRLGTTALLVQEPPTFATPLTPGRLGTSQVGGSAAPR